MGRRHSQPCLCLCLCLFLCLCMRGAHDMNVRACVHTYARTYMCSCTRVHAGTCSFFIFHESLRDVLSQVDTDVDVSQLSEALALPAGGFRHQLLFLEWCGVVEACAKPMYMTYYIMVAAQMRTQPFWAGCSWHGAAPNFKVHCRCAKVAQRVGGAYHDFLVFVTMCLGLVAWCWLVARLRVMLTGAWHRCGP